MKIMFITWLMIAICFSNSDGDVIIDNQLNSQQSIALEGPIYNIQEEYGKRTGSNLFHSFKQFDIGLNETADFTGDPSVTNIISRVRGDKHSQIDGTIKSSIPGANLYLINPAGIVFGSNSSINVSGSFHAATSDYIKFSDNTIFSTNPMASDNLTSAPPVAFGFLEPPKGNITFTGKASDSNVGKLKVSEQKEITLIGKNISIENQGQPKEMLQAPGGRINLIAVNSPGEISIKPSGIDMSCEQLGDITIKGKSKVDVSGNAGGSIFIRGGQFVIRDSELNANTINKDGGIVDIRTDSISFENGSKISGKTTEIGKGPDVVLNSKDSIQFTGDPISQDTVSMIDLQTEKKSSDGGNTGNVTIKAKNITFDNGSRISMTSVGGGDCGNVSIQASESVKFINTKNKAWNSKIEMRANGKIKGAGNSGNVWIEARDILFDGGSYVSTSTLGEGNAGNIVLNASDSVIFKGEAPNRLPSRIYTRTYDREEIGGNAGTLTVKANSIHFLDGSFILAETFGAGHGGNISLTASDAVVFSGKTSAKIPSSIKAEAKSNRIDAGNGGTISIHAGSIQLMDGASISSATLGNGNAGNILLTFSKDLLLKNGSFIENTTTGFGKGGNTIVRSTGNIILEGMDEDGYSSRITSDSTAKDGITGNGGSIEINGNRLYLKEGASISSNTIATGTGKSGTAGNISIKLSDHAIISGINPYGKNEHGFSSGIFAISKGVGDSSGRAGSIDMLTDNFLYLEKGAMISTNTFGQAEGGNINISAGNLLLVSGDPLNHPLLSPIQSQNSFPKRAVSDSYSSVGTGIFAETNSLDINAGNGGKIVIRASNIDLNNYGKISTSSYGIGNAGVIELSGSRMSLANGASVSSSSNSIDGGNAGTILLYLNNFLSLSDTSKITTSTQGYGNAGNIELYTNSLLLNNSSEISSSTNMNGNGGVLDIYSVDFIEIMNNSHVTTSTKGIGTAGSINIKTNQLNMADGSDISSASYAKNLGGNAGLITISGGEKSCDHIKLDDGSNIETVSYGSGNAGSIMLNVKQLDMDHGSAISSSSLSTGFGGQGGLISISANQTSSDSIRLSNNSFINTSSAGYGDAGMISIDVNHLKLLDASGITSSSDLKGVSGDAGKISIKAKENPTQLIQIADGSYISTKTSGTGDAGSITIDTIELDINKGTIFSSSLYETNGGTAGTIVIQSKNSPKSAMRLAQNSLISTSSAGWGDAGSILLNIDQLELMDESIVSSSNSCMDKSGNAGKIVIKTDNHSCGSIRLIDGSKVTTSNEGTGDAGTIQVETTVLEMINSSISSSSLSQTDGGNAGEISITGKDKSVKSVSLKDESSIQTISEGKGHAGAIRIQTASLELENGSKISSSSNHKKESGNSGIITIDGRDIPTDRIQLSGGSSISTSNNGDHKGGNIQLYGKNLYLTDKSWIKSTAVDGNAGIIIFNSRRELDSSIFLNNNSGISTSVYGTGNAGEIFLNANQFELLQESVISSASTFQGEGGNAGKIVLTTKDHPSGVIRLSNSSSISTSTEGRGDAGAIYMETPQLEMRNSEISSSNFSQTIGGNAGEIVIRWADKPSEKVYLVDKSAIQTKSQSSGNAGAIKIQTTDFALENGSVIESSCTHPTHSGNAGTVLIDAMTTYTKSFRLTDGSSISTSNDGTGKGGNIYVKANQIMITDNSSITSTAVHGNGGKISIDSENDPISRMIINNSSMITTSVFGNGNAGNIELTIHEIDIDHQSVISSSSEASSQGGNGGSIHICSFNDSNTVRIRNGSSLSTKTNNLGNAGDIILSTRQLELDSNASISSVSASPDKGGNGGIIKISAKEKASDSVLVLDNSSINTSSEGDGNGGNIHIRTNIFFSVNSNISSTANMGDAGNILLDSDLSANGFLIPVGNYFLQQNSHITTSTNGIGNAGNIRVFANQLHIDSNSGIISDSKANGISGNGGLIDIYAHENLIISGKNSLISTSSEGTGTAGSIRIFGNKLDILNEARISSESHAGFGGGLAGSISISANQSILLTDDASITTAALSSGGGIINIFSDQFHMTNSKVTTSVLSGAGNGGDIHIASDFILLKNSQIIAKAYEGNGGNILITSNLFIPSSDSILSASSEFGLEGSITIESPEKNIVNIPVALPSNFLNAEIWIQSPCPLRSGEHVSRFVYRDSYGVPITFMDLVPSSIGIRPLVYSYSLLPLSEPYLKKYYHLTDIFE